MFEDVVRQVEEADARAMKAQMAFALGPDAYRTYWEAEGDAIRKRIAESYGGDAGTNPVPVVSGAGGGGERVSDGGARRRD
jgi:hypothetical protein